jgi:hypothetical protein
MLPKPLSQEFRRLLQKAVLKARAVAERGARASLESLAVHEGDPYKTLRPEQKELRRELIALSKQLGDGEDPRKKGSLKIDHLSEKLAYQAWHRLFFARLLLENKLLVHPKHGVELNFEELQHFAHEDKTGLTDPWKVASDFTVQLLPGVFPLDDPSNHVDIPAREAQELRRILTDLPIDVFLGGDTLGWNYQYWQEERKQEINDSGVKIGQEELSPVTQLFTEDYMIDFIHHNTLGAWWAGKKFPNGIDAPDEIACRQQVQVGDVEWKYLRFIQDEKTKKWKPAAGVFEGWPKTAKEIKYLDPCMGSGHFIVFALPILVAMRQEEEKLSVGEAVDAVIRENLYGLELDPRCTQIAAFHLAWTAWMMAGYRPLPDMNLACCGLALHGKKEAWEKLGGKDTRLQAAMGKMYDLFKHAPVLGSLINPRQQAGNLIEAEFHEIQPLLSKALAKEEVKKDENLAQMGLVAKGNAKAAEILAGQFTLVATNVPYLGRGKQDEVLAEYCERVYPESLADLATCFVERCIEFCSSNATTALVTPQNWLFLGSYEELRVKLLKTNRWDFVARLGFKAFETPMFDFNVMLAAFSRQHPNTAAIMFQWDVGMESVTSAKGNALAFSPHFPTKQIEQLGNPDTRITLEEPSKLPRLGKFAFATEGLSTGDRDKFIRCFWETNRFAEDWSFYQTSPSSTGEMCGFSNVLFWQNGEGELASSDGARIQGDAAWEKIGILVGRVGGIRSERYYGQFFDKSNVVIIPRDPKNLPALACFCFSDALEIESRKLDQKLGMATSVLDKVPFDLAHWQKVAAEKYPDGLPKPHSDDPTQWLFNGHPAGSDQPLQVAVARLLGYQWPRQTGSSFPDCPALGPDGLEKHQDNDGIVCLNPISGEAPAADRLQSLLSEAYGKEWKATTLKTLLEKEDSEATEDWLRNKFFESHCALFHRRPFIWQIWDGKKDGFSALVNYHKLNKANLEKLTYVYLGDWIKRQEQEEKQGKAGATGKKEAALELQNKLKLIIEGEAPYDVFVRWKPLAQQAIGWNPDLNDGVRLNIRPFVEAGIFRKDPKVKWDKDRGTEPMRDKGEFPWFWKEKEPGTDPVAEKAFAGRRWNCVHLTLKRKKESIKGGKESSVALRSRGLPPQEQSLRFE